MNEIVNEALAKRLAEAGKITFAEFMSVALYHPTDGYYNRLNMTIGEEGDFYTSPMVHPIFGACLARQVWEMWSLLGRPDEWFVLEMGAGVGTMMVDFLRMASHQEAFYQALRYTVVEQSPALRERQRAHAAEHGFAEKVTWYQTLDEVPGPGERVGVIVSNELFDALPVHRLGKTADGYVEFYIESDGAGGYREVEGALSDLALIELISDETKQVLQPGDRFEVCSAAADVITGMGRLLQQGFVLTIDYGDTAPDVHLEHHRRDGVRAYYKQKLAPVLERVGEQDLTADVDFTLLMERGEQAGLATVGYTNQMHLLGGNGFLQKVKELQSRKMDLMADAELFKMLNLFLPQALGEVFKVLIQAKGVNVQEAKQRISALTFSIEE